MEADFPCPLAFPGMAGSFQQDTGADHIGLEELDRTEDGAVDMRFGRKVDDGVDGIVRHHPVEQLAVADAAVDECEAVVGTARGKVLFIAGVGQQVQPHHAQVFAAFQ